MPQVSARNGEGLDELRRRIAERFADRLETVMLLIPYGEGRALSELYELGVQIEERADVAEGVHLRARLPRREIRRFVPYLLADEAARETA